MAVKPLNPNLGKGSNLTHFLDFFVFKNWFSHLIFTQVGTNSSIFNQSIIHGDTLRGSNWDA
jgi:hypothetical protein